MEDDNLPYKICGKCTETVLISFDLVQLCIASEQKLRNWKNGTTEGLGDNLRINILAENSCQNDYEFSVTEEVSSDLCGDDTADHMDDTKEIDYHGNSSHKYLCGTCMISFTNKIKYHRHLKLHDTTKQIKCEHCEEMFSKKIHLNVHLRSHMRKEDKQFVCSICGEPFIFEYLLKQHSYKHSEKRPFTCNKCGKGK